MDPYTIRSITFWSIVVLSLANLAYPWRIAGRLSRWALHLPAPILALIVLHEALMPELRHRPDLLAIITLAGPVFGAYCFRLCLLTETRPSHRPAPQRFDELTRSERRALLPFNHEPEAEQLAKLQR